MKRIVAIIILVVLIGIIYFGITTSNIKETTSSSINNSQNKVGIEKGNIAPDFELATLDGERVKLTNFRGKKVILNFWATWCPPCRAEMPDLQKFYAQNKDEVVVLSINLLTSEKNPENVSHFIKEFGMTFPVVLDKDGGVASKYQVSAIPTSYILDTNGVIQQKIVGSIHYETLSKYLSKN